MLRFPSRLLSSVIPVLLGIFVLLLFLSAFSALDPLRSRLLALTQPVYGKFYGAGSSLLGRFRESSDVEGLQRENENLRDENARYKLEMTRLQSAAQENQTLRQLLDFFESDSSSLPRVVARIVGRDPADPASLLLNVGARDGVTVNGAVIVQDGILVAKISEVFAQSSKAILLTDNRSRVAVTISGGLPTSKIVRGERGLSLILDQIPQQEVITDGQLVITSGLEPTIPRGLVLGEIEQKISENNDLFQSAILRPLVDFDAIHIVAVILPPK